MSSSSTRNVVIQPINRRKYPDIHEEWKAKLPTLTKMCVGIEGVSQRYGQTDLLAYIKDSKENMKAFAFVSEILSGRTIDKKMKKVKFLSIDIICAGIHKRGYGRLLMNEVERYAKDNAYEYLTVSEPTESAKGFYSKLGFDIIEDKGTIDQVIMFDCAWKRLS
jgi:GNAT superfamily N-acetyltransferase